ncbi:MAG: DUF4386 family protein [Terracidiphilus sp.]
MNDQYAQRIAGACGLASLALFLVEFPIYFLRGPLPSVTSATLPAYSARNATNMLVVVFLDLLIYCLFLVFLSGLRQRLAQAQAACTWLADLVFGAGVVYTTLTLAADACQGAIALDARSAQPDPVVIRTLMESQYLLFGSVGLILIALLLAGASWATLASRALPRWTAWLGLAAAALCLAFVPSMFAGAPDLGAFYNPAGWGTTGVIAGFPLAAWMLVVSLQMVRDPRAGGVTTRSSARRAGSALAAAPKDLRTRGHL